MTRDISLFALDASREYGEKIAALLGISLSPHEERTFEDGEHKARPLVSVRDRDVFVIHSLYGDPDESGNDKLCKLLFFIGALRDASAARVTAIVPYLAYARKDRRTQPRDPVITRYVAALFEAVGVDRILTMDAHNLAAFQNAFRCPTEHLEARPLFAQVENKAVIIIDDLISTGTTIGRATRACLGQGATRVGAAATHGLFIGADDVIASPGLSKTVVTDTIPPFRLDPGLVEQKVVVLSAAPLFAGAIKAIHSGGSIAALLGG